MNVWMRRTTGVVIIAAGLIAAGSGVAQAKKMPNSDKPPAPSINFHPSQSGDVTGATFGDFINKGDFKGDPTISADGKDSTGGYYGYNPSVYAPTTGHSMPFNFYGPADD